MKPQNGRWQYWVHCSFTKLWCDFSSYSHKVAAIGHFDFPMFTKLTWFFQCGSSVVVSNMNCICVLVFQLVTHVLPCSGVGGERRVPKTQYPQNLGEIITVYVLACHSTKSPIINLQIAEGFQRLTKCTCLQ